MSVNSRADQYAGEGGFNVDVKGHTQLNGGVIASTATADKNQFSTGSLGFADIENQAEYKATSSGINIGTGSLLSNALKNASSALPMSGNQSGEANSTTHAAISPGSITIGGQAATDAQLAGLSRDTANAANSIKPIFDLQKVQDDMALGQVVGEIGTQLTQITTTALQRNEYVDRDKAMATAESKLTPAQQKEYNSDYYKEHPEEKAGYLAKIDRENALTKDPLLTKTLDNLSSDLKPSERQALMDQLAREGSLGLVAKANQQYIDVQNEYGIGSGFGRAAQALTGLASGIAGGNIGQGLSAAAAPYLAGEVGDYFDKLEVKNGKTDEITAARLLAHAAVGAAVAYASGNNATSGAIGGVSGEAMAMIVHKQLYDDKPVDQLTQAEKANIRATATLASGLVGGVAGGSFENAAVAAGAGYNAAVNNQMSCSRGTPQQCAKDSQNFHPSPQVLSTMLNVTPGLGTAKTLIEAYLAKDLITGAELSDFERGLNVALSLTGPAAKLVADLIDTARVARMAGDIAGAQKALKEAENIVYISNNPVSGAVQYVGITNNLAVRAATHLREKGINVRPLLENLSRSDARAVEQVLIEMYGLGKNGGTLMNKIYSIATTNPAYAAQVARGYQLLRSIGYVE